MTRTGARLPARWPLIFVALLPRHLASRLAGALAAIRWPSVLQRWLNRAFVALAGVDASESELPITSYPSIQALFTRRLRPGLRPLDTERDADALMSPVDGRVGECGMVSAGTAVQVKGRSYTVARLLGEDAPRAELEGGTFATLYLSPRDYHRIHAPAAGRVTEARYLPGRLWPVNPRAVAHIDDLFAANERLVVWLETRRGPLALVAVGATLVGRVVVSFDDLTTNVRRGTRVVRRYEAGTTFAPGDELGRFEFGSTVVMVAPPATGVLAPASPGSVIRVGERIGTLRQAGSGS